MSTTLVDRKFFCFDCSVENEKEVVKEVVYVRKAVSKENVFDRAFREGVVKKVKGKLIYLLSTKAVGRIRECFKPQHYSNIFQCVAHVRRER